MFRGFHSLIVFVIGLLSEKQVTSMAELINLYFHYFWILISTVSSTFLPRFNTKFDCLCSPLLIIAFLGLILLFTGTLALIQRNWSLMLGDKQGAMI